jgi:3-hydroxyisobutyrate dehydrogenase-like beta-hydroxyacid dehydrogenase
MRMFKSVGLVGVGAMGQALLHRLILAGARVKAFDISEEALTAARNLGAEVVESAAEAARGVDAVHLFVRTDEEEVAATTGPDGILRGAAPGTVLILHSTVLPETTRRVAEAAAKVKVDVVDAPVTAVPRHVHAGEAVFLLGGDPEVVARTRPHLEALGERSYHFGPLGSGNVAKIAKNLATAIERVAAAEIVWLAEAGGLDPKDFFEMMRVEHNHPVMQRWDAAFTIENGHAVPRPASNLLNKDVGLAAEYARARNVTARVTKGAADTAAEWVAQWEKEGRAR